MKKTVIIITTTALLLASCGNSDKVQEMDEQIVALQAQVNDMT